MRLQNEAVRVLFLLQFPQREDLQHRALQDAQYCGRVRQRLFACNALPEPGCCIHLIVEKRQTCAANDVTAEKNRRQRRHKLRLTAQCHPDHPRRVAVSRSDDFVRVGIKTPDINFLVASQPDVDNPNAAVINHQHALWPVQAIHDYCASALFLLRQRAFGCDPQP